MKSFESPVQVILIIFALLLTRILYHIVKQKLENKTKFVKISEIQLRKIREWLESIVILMVAGMAISLAYMTFKMANSIPDTQTVEVSAKVLLLTNSSLIMLMILLFFAFVKALDGRYED